MALVVYNGKRQFKVKSPITGKEYEIVPLAQVNMDDYDATFFFGYDIRENLTDADIEYVILPRLDWQIDLEEWKNAITFELVGKVSRKKNE